MPSIECCMTKDCNIVGNETGIVVNPPAVNSQNYVRSELNCRNLQQGNDTGTNINPQVVNNQNYVRSELNCRNLQQDGLPQEKYFDKNSNEIMSEKKAVAKGPTYTTLRTAKKTISTDPMLLTASDDIAEHIDDLLSEITTSQKLHSTHSKLIDVDCEVTSQSTTAKPNQLPSDKPVLSEATAQRENSSADKLIKALLKGSKKERKKRFGFTAAQITYLMEMYRIEQYPIKMQIDSIASYLGVEARVVGNFFQNRRAKEKRERKKKKF